MCGKSLHDAFVEHAGLRVDERGAVEQGAGTVLKHLLDFIIGNGQTQFVSFRFDEFVGHVGLPYPVAYLGQRVV